MLVEPVAATGAAAPGVLTAASLEQVKTIETIDATSRIENLSIGTPDLEECCATRLEHGLGAVTKICFCDENLS